MTIPTSSQAGPASARIRLGGQTEDTDGGGRIRCSSCGIWYALDDDHTCPSDAVMAALPWHAGVWDDARVASYTDHLAELNLLVGATPLIAHSSKIARHLTLVPGRTAA